MPLPAAKVSVLLNSELTIQRASREVLPGSEPDFGMLRLPMPKLNPLELAFL